MATSDENPFWRDPELRRKFFDVDPADGRPPALLRRRRAGRRARRGSGGVRDDAPARARARARGARRRGADRPSGRARRPARATSSACAARASSGSGSRRSSSPARRCATGRSRARRATSSRTTCRRSSSIRAGEAIARPSSPGEARPWRELAFEAKLEQARTTFQPEVERLRRLLDVPDLERALASLPVYRTYVEPWSGRVEEADREALADLPGDGCGGCCCSRTRGHDEFVTRFQQTDRAGDGEGRRGHGVLPLRPPARAQRGRRRSRPVRASPSTSSTRANARACARASRAALLAGTTHDTKRSADVRARIGALAGMAERWREHVLRWHELERAAARRRRARTGRRSCSSTRRSSAPGRSRPSGSRPYLEKALREAKRNTNWVEPNERWEAARQALLPRALVQDEPFLADFVPFVGARSPSWASGRRSASSCCGSPRPACPTSTTATSCWYLALVDPDNRRPVDWDARRAALDALVGRAGRRARPRSCT